MGGGFKNQNREIFEAPYVHSNWPEGCSKYWYRAVIGKNAAVYSEPDANSQVIARLSYCIVQMLKTDSEIWQKTDSEIWQKIIMPDRKEGYVSKESVRSYYDYSVRFEKKSGKWLMTIFAELPEQRRIPYPPP
jgi:pectate lyase